MNSYPLTSMVIKKFGLAVPNRDDIEIVVRDLPISAQSVDHFVRTGKLHGALRRRIQSLYEVTFPRGEDSSKLKSEILEILNRYRDHVLGQSNISRRSIHREHTEQIAPSAGCCDNCNDPLDQHFHCVYCIKYRLCPSCEQANSTENFHYGGQHLFACVPAGSIFTWKKVWTWRTKVLPTRMSVQAAHNIRIERAS